MQKQSTNSMAPCKWTFQNGDWKHIHLEQWTMSVCTAICRYNMCHIYLYLLSLIWLIEVTPSLGSVTILFFLPETKSLRLLLQLAETDPVPASQTPFTSIAQSQFNSFSGFHKFRSIPKSIDGKLKLKLMSNILEKSGNPASEQSNMCVETYPQLVPMCGCVSIFWEDGQC